MTSFLRCILCGIFAMHGLSHAATIRVPLDQPTIQAGIDAAVEGDTVLVAAGTYVENIDFGTKNVIVESEDGAATTIIDGGGTNIVVAIAQSQTRDAILRGFTITNGFGLGAAGVYVFRASPTVEDNIITGNVACYGAGLAMSFSSALIQRNQIIGNTQDNCSSSLGGSGVRAAGAGTPEFYDNLIASNTHEFAAGMSLGLGSDVIVARNEISGNQAQFVAGIRLDTADGFDIRNNLIHGNMAQFGSALAIGNTLPTGDQKVRFNTFYNNSGAAGPVVGTSNAAEFTSNIIIAPDGQTAVSCTNTQPTFRANNVVAGNGGLLYDGSCTDQTGMTGNVSADPGFADTPGADFRLAAGSAMLDAAFNDVDITVDFLQNARQIDGTGDMVADSDIGAFEAAPPLASAGADATIDVDSLHMLDGTGSSDADGSIVSYQWTQIAGTAVTLANDTSPTAEFTAPTSAAMLEFELLVTDDLGYEGTDNVSVMVNAPPPPPPPPAPPPTSSGGSGMMSPIWTIGLLILLLATRSMRRVSLRRGEYSP